MKQVLAFGDSNTWGYNPENGERFGWGVRWTSILQKNMETDQVHIIEEGLCGRTTVFEDELRDGRRGIDALPILLESHAPLDAVVLMLGTNDCKSIYHASEYEIGKGIARLLDKIRQIQKTAKVLLMSPIWLGDNVWEPEFDPEFDEKSVQTSHRLKAVYEKVAQDYGIEFLAASDYATYSQADREHMDADNHGKLAAAVEGKLREII